MIMIMMMMMTCSDVMLEDTGKVSDGVGTLNFRAQTSPRVALDMHCIVKVKCLCLLVGIAADVDREEL